MEHLKIAFKNISLLSLIILISYFSNLGCGNILTDKKLELIKDSLSNKSEYLNPEYINKQIMLRCWLNFKSETIVNYTVATYSTNNILQSTQQIIVQQPTKQQSKEQQPKETVQQPEQQFTTQNQKIYYNGCGYSYESKEDCMKQCGAFTQEETCQEGQATGKIIKASNTEAKSAVAYYKIQDPDGYTNLRKTPNGDVIRKVYATEKFEVIGDENKFKKVKFEDGTIGYIHQSRVVSL